MQQLTQMDGDPLVGSLIADRYQVEELLGAGAMGAVYRANQVGLERPVALKVLKKDLTWGGDTVARFRREAQAMSALTHPNTVRVFDFGATEEGLLFLAMELLEGELATQRTQRLGKLEVSEAIRYAIQVLQSIEEAHSKKIIHRDLKPDNIFLADVEGRPEPSVKVLDFGIAKAVEGERAIDQFETQDGTVFGTPRYMSPEQAQGKPLDHRSDLYAVGVMLYEFLVGEPPFVDPDAVIVMAKHIREQPASLSKVVPERPIGTKLEQVVKRALHKSPELRFQSAGDFTLALELCRPEVERLEGAAAKGRRIGTLNRLRAAPRTTLLATGLAGLAALLTVWLLATDGAEVKTEAAVAPQAPQAVAGQPRRRLVEITSRPAGADVWRDGEVVGVTPLELALSKGELVRLKVAMTGHAEAQIDVSWQDGLRHVVLPERGEQLALPAGAPPPTAELPAQEKTGKAPRPRKRKKVRRRPRPRPGEADSPYEKF